MNKFNQIQYFFTEFRKEPEIKSQMIDTHAHIYLEEFKNDRADMLERAENEGIEKILLPAIDSDTQKEMLQLAAAFPDKCLAMMGLHPCSVKENFAAELKIVEDYLAKQKFIALGEIGLDFYWDKTFTEQQYAAFHTQIEWALQYDLPIVIHSRNSIDECIEGVAAHQNGKLKGVFHCFSGNPEQANKIIDLGFFMGIGGVVTFKNSGLDKVLQDVNLEHLVLETDAPYLTPVPFRGKRNEPAYLKYIAERLAVVKERGIEEIAEITTQNARRLFGL